jgi:hypothetical protein
MYIWVRSTGKDSAPKSFSKVVLYLSIYLSVYILFSLSLVLSISLIISLSLTLSCFPSLALSCSLCLVLSLYLFLSLINLSPDTCPKRPYLHVSPPYHSSLPLFLPLYPPISMPFFTISVSKSNSVTMGTHYIYVYTSSLSQAKAKVTGEDIYI